MVGLLGEGGLNVTSPSGRTTSLMPRINNLGRAGAPDAAVRDYSGLDDGSEGGTYTLTATHPGYNNASATASADGSGCHLQGFHVTLALSPQLLSVPDVRETGRTLAMLTRATITTAINSRLWG